MTRQDIVLDVHERPKVPQWISLSIQHLFAMFGATILVPFLVGLSPSVALISSGLSTLGYLVITKGQIPAYLGSSFAFIAPVIAAKASGGPGTAMLVGFMAGMIYGIVALLIKQFGVKWLLNILPPIVVGPVIMVIGLGLAGNAVNMAMRIDPNDAATYSSLHFSVALVTLFLTIIATMFFKGFFGVIPVLFGIVCGYTYAAIVGIVDFSGVTAAKWFEAPELLIPFVTYSPELKWSVAIAMLPVVIVTFSENIGHQMVLSKVINRNLLVKPGLHRAIAGDGFALTLASLIGGPPNTTYGENIGVLAITRVFSVFVIGGAAVFAIIFGFIGKFSALISSIPTNVMGGVSILLFGIIASSGLRMLIDNKVDFSKNRNLIIASVILVIGIGGAFIQVTEQVQISGMALAAIIGAILNFVLPGREKNVDENALLSEDNN
ncbi:solute carrier family 23 protein [Schinkia azotoformans]|uniref:Uracil-xanthine permease n=1 Tax=Schinkia azotoformans LMG 9581 TaxID=1131731 RepID=K6DL17_SCHAZ|nr:solute carrier family 23 protein [Schinkia azotoformans]EKN68863.1 uracil-xanthine permease [Schinkia azotoformans LMG 9581]MEC1638336.1 solute carrier family 23 protein [Schinkia azotoformans]MEC1721113.1 solute carrier family 23 protein [Schinkia azotoformans]MEC1946230.1 solute carrier family 23 protein [Schinkia azotoformans]MED4412364.1 solute carrier family 23 protein [Schinkia azotoformans]